MLEQQTLFPPGDGEDNDSSLTLGLFAQQAYLDYAISVVKGRALPDGADGLKPVQRRILYAMNAMGLAAGARPVKSARVVGDVLGRYHPHGDQAAYDAMVRMAQDFSLRYPLIDGQGNFGSRDGDGAAAMRYTEARLTPIARLLLDEIDEGTVDFMPNYDGSTQEPRLLPARLPFVLLNGASGIAVGMATEIPSHNLREVADATLLLMKDPKATLDQVLRALPGPDFPGGGQIISSRQEIRDVYATGRGSLKVRARYEFEELARGQWQLVVKQLPPGASAQRVLEEIEELTNPKVKAGKKALTAEQQQTKQLVLSVLDAVRDESGKDAAVRLVFEPRTSKIDRDELARVLLSHTSMESSAPVNLVMIGRDGRPRCKPLTEVLLEWIEFRVATVRRRSSHRLQKVQDRIHILEGRQAILLNIDKVIKLIRNSDEPKPDLMKAFKLSERQADDILEIRLRQLARLEGIRIEQELADLRKDESALGKLLGSDAALRRQVAKEVEEDAKKYGDKDKRRTLIEEAERSTFEVRLADEPVTVIVSEMGFVRARGGHGHDASQFTFKTGDALYAAFECRTVDTLAAIGSNGRVYSVPVAQLPSARGDGSPVTSMIDLAPGSRLIGYVAGAAATPLLFATSNGHGFTATLGDLASRQKGGKQFINVDEGAEPLRPQPFDAARETGLACLSGKGRVLVFGLSEVKAQPGGGRGVKLMDLDDGEKLLIALPVSKAGAVLRAVKGTAARPVEVALSGAALEAQRGHRARKGKMVDPKLKPPFRLERARGG
ncbi:MAG: DNA topoisomerase IV subunit A [Burkholderiaceae bacterium]|jgi:topoisomerase IV subunit A|nr:DNA topoisomerase IV subunit A [Burkholderiaceae bacterium]